MDEGGEESARAAKRRRFLIDVPMGTPVSLCRGPDCSAEIYWVRTQRNKLLPVDCAADHGGVAPTNSASGRGVAHFAVCPNADGFRKAR